MIMGVLVVILIGKECCGPGMETCYLDLYSCMLLSFPVDNGVFFQVTYIITIYFCHIIIIII